jgi:hypothetical protein
LSASRYRPGDAWAIHPDNPLEVTTGRFTRADFTLRQGGRPGLARGGAVATGKTGLTGRAVDPAGSPVAGLTALVYRGQDIQRMPDFAAAPTGGDGRFVVHLPTAGRYCVVLRSRTRGQPRRGELYGTLEPRTAPCREIAAGQMLDVGTVTVAPYRR